MSTYKDLPSTIKVGAAGSMTFLRDAEYLSRVHIPADPGPKEFYVAPHWHESHDELFRILKGRMEVLIGMEKRFYKPEDGEICIPKGVTHSLRIVKGEECIFEERTEPMDDEKELFFRNFVSLNGGFQVTRFFAAMQIMYHGDMRPVLPLHVKWLETLLVIIVGKYIASLLGYRLPVPNLKKDD